MNWLERIRMKVRTEAAPWWERFTVSTDDDGFIVVESGPHGIVSRRHAGWAEITSTVFVDGGQASDVIDLNVAGQESPIRIPVECVGGDVFWSQLLARGIFPEGVAGEAVRSAQPGRRILWPPSR